MARCSVHSSSQRTVSRAIARGRPSASAKGARRSQLRALLLRIRGHTGGSGARVVDDRLVVLMRSVREVHADWEKAALVSWRFSCPQSKRGRRTDVHSSLAKLLDHVDAVGLGSWKERTRPTGSARSSAITRDRSAASSPIVAMIEVCTTGAGSASILAPSRLLCTSPPHDVERTLRKNLALSVSSTFGGMARVVSHSS